MTIFIWDNEYFIWTNQLKITYSLRRHSSSQYVTESVGKSPAVRCRIDLDQYSLYGSWHTQVNDRFSRIINILTVIWILIWHIHWLSE